MFIVEDISEYPATFCHPFLPRGAVEIGNRYLQARSHDADLLSDGATQLATSVKVVQK